jgi:hypothetical protein
MPATKPATPEQILMYGHIAAALRSFMEKKGWGPADLNHAMGKDRSYSAGYQLVNGKTGAGSKLLPKLMKITGLSAEQLTMRKIKTMSKSTAIVTYKPSKTSRLNDVLVFSVTSDGKARIKVDIELPLESATPLLRMLLDAGLVYTIS